MGDDLTSGGNGATGAGPHRLRDAARFTQPSSGLRDLLAVMQRVLRRFASLDDGAIEDGIGEVIRTIGEHTRVDRCYVFSIDHDSDTLRNTHEWCAPGVAPEIHNLQRVPFEAVGYWRDPLQRGETIHIPDVAALPDARGEERELLQSQNIQSLVVVPLLGPQCLQGFIGFDAVHARRYWPDEALILLRAVADVLVGALQRRAASDRLATRERRFSALARHSTDLVIILDTARRIEYLGPSAEKQLSPECAAARGEHLSTLAHPDDQALLHAALDSQLAVEGRSLPDFRLRARDGRWRWFLATASDLREDAAVRGIVINAHDIDRRKRAEEALRQAATHDALTDLPNRLLLGELLTRCIARAARRELSLGVVFIDLDHFKLVNDAMGHRAGDEILKQTAARLSRAMRNADVVARFGGDEFVAILESDRGGPDQFIAATERLLAQFQEPFAVGTATQKLSASAGLVISSGERNAEELLRDADAAMYRAKEDARGSLQCFDAAMRGRVLERLSLLDDLRQAIEQDALQLHYQPIFDAATGRLRGAEALLRWHHVTRGWVSPAHFIPLAEQSGLIMPIGRWVLDTALDQLQRWAGRATADGFFISVNLSVHQLARPELFEDIVSGLQRRGLAPAALCLEVTESALMQDRDANIRLLGELKAAGVSLALDDFGTGYSSFAYLRDLPATELKIDRSFVDVMLDDPRVSGIVGAICTLAQQFGLVTIAEGVETEAQARALRNCGCAMLQGFHLAGRAPAAQTAALFD